MTRDYRKTVLNQAIQKSKDGHLYVVLLSDSIAMIVCGENEAAALANTFGYRVYAKCKDGCMVL